jgi:hypothetical protein
MPTRQLTPREYIGICAISTDETSTRGWYWFTSFASLRKYLGLVIEEQSSMDGEWGYNEEDSGNTASALRACLRIKGGLNQNWKEILENFHYVLKNKTYMDFDWYGCLEDILTGNFEEVRDILGQYWDEREENQADASEKPDPQRPIPEDLVQDFLEFMTELGDGGWIE